MAGIRKSARIVDVQARCGHMTMIQVPPGELGTVGRQNMAQAQAQDCYECQKAREGGVRMFLLPPDHSMIGPDKYGETHIFYRGRFLNVYSPHRFMTWENHVRNLWWRWLCPDSDFRTFLRHRDDILEMYWQLMGIRFKE